MFLYFIPPGTMPVVSAIYVISLLQELHGCLFLFSLAGAMPIFFIFCHFVLFGPMPIRMFDPSRSCFYYFFLAIYLLSLLPELFLFLVSHIVPAEALP